MCMIKLRHLSGRLVRLADERRATEIWVLLGCQFRFAEPPKLPIVPGNNTNIAVE